MESRKQKDVEDILDFIKSKWKLSLVEEDVLDSVLLSFSAQKIEEIDKIKYLVNDEIRQLLHVLNDYEIIDYAQDYLNMIDESDVEECDNCTDLEEYSDDELLDECDRRDLKLEVDTDYRDIVSQAMAQEWMELFENMTMQQRDLYINQIRGEV